MIDNIFFTATPSASRTLAIGEEYRRLLIKNLIGCISALQVSMDLDFSAILLKYKSLDTATKFSPAIFTYFIKLVNACKSGKVAEIIDALHYLNVLDASTIFDSAFKISSILTEPWEMDFITCLRGHEMPNGNNEPMLVLPILTSDLSYYENIVSTFFELIQKADSDFYGEFQANVTRLKLFNGKALKAATAAEIFGTIVMRIPNVTEDIDLHFAENLIHEASHLQLDMLLAFDEMVLNDDSERYSAPLRIDTRPMLGIFHATFVLSRMVRLFTKFTEVDSRAAVRFKLEQFRKQFEQGFETVHKHGRLTERGQLVFDSFREIRNFSL